MFLFCCPVYDDIKDILFTQMFSISDDFFWLGDYEKLELQDILFAKLGGEEYIV